MWREMSGRAPWPPRRCVQLHGNARSVDLSPAGKKNLRQQAEKFEGEEPLKLPSRQHDAA